MKSFLETLKAALIGLAMATAVVGAMLLVVGCSEIKGGEQRHVEAGVRSEILPDGTMRREDTRKEVATTQNSVKTTARALPQTETAKEGEIAGVKFTEMRATVQANWFLFAIFLGCAAVSWFVLHRWVWTAVCVAMALLSVVYPAAIVILCLGTLAITAVVLLYDHNKKFAQVVQGAEVALNNMPPVIAAQAKTLMATKQDASTQQAVAAVTAPSDAMKPVAVVPAN